MKDPITRARELLEFDRTEASAKAHQVYVDHFDHPERYRLIVARIAGAEREHARTASLVAAMLECVETAAAGLWINECRCDEAFTGRGMHEPNALCGEMDGLVSALARLEAALLKADEGA